MSNPWAGISKIRVVIGTAGGLVLTFGVFRLGTEIPVADLLALALWLGGALVLHDAVLSPGIVGVGGMLRRIPSRARTYVQGALIAGGLLTVIAIPMIYRAGREPEAKAILEQDFRANLALLLAVVLVGALLAYLRRVAHERFTAGPAGAMTDRPSEDHASTAE